MRVLIACEYSGVVRDAFARRGHNAMSVDLLPCESTLKYVVPPGHAHHFQGDIMSNGMLDQGWDLMIAHPPCTYLCSSGLHWNKRRPERAQQTEEALEFVDILMHCDIPRICIENPVGCIGTRIRKADQYIQPYQFGHDASKKTGLWLKNLPKLATTEYVEPRRVCCGATLDTDKVGRYGCPNCNGDNPENIKYRWGNQTDSGQNKHGPSATRGLDRARTYQGIADVMAATWG